jgi:hypothetical protein
MKDGKFEIGDGLVCVDASGIDLKEGERYKFLRYTDGGNHVYVEDKFCEKLGSYLAARFKLAEPAKYFSALNEQDNDKSVEIVRLTEEMFLELLKGKDFYLIITNEKQEEKRFIFKPPWDGVFLTHAELSRLEHAAEMRAFAIVEKLNEYKPKEYSVKSKRS